MDKKIKLFVYADAVCANTGFGSVVHNIVKRLLATGKYEVHNLGINYWGDSVPEHKWENLYLYPMQGDPYGRNRILPLLLKVKPDILFIVNDYDACGHIPQILLQYKEKTGKTLPFVLHFPVDGSPIYPEWTEFIKKFVTKPVVISKYGLEIIKQTDPTLKVEQCYHGVDIETFKPLPEEQVKQFKESLGNKFVILGVSVNQLRKQWPILLEAYAHFSKDKDNVLLFLHTQRNLSMGWDLDKLCRLFNIHKKVVFTDGLDGLNGVSRDELNMIYNCADVYVTTNCGEGFGLCSLEAMSAGKPIIYPDNTSNTELISDAGVPIPTDHYTIFPNRDRELIRPIPSTKHLIETLNKMYYNETFRKEMSEKAYNRAMELYHSGQTNWDKVSEYFDNVFEEVLKEEDNKLDIEEII